MEARDPRSGLLCSCQAPPAIQGRCSQEVDLETGTLKTGTLDPSTLEVLHTSSILIDLWPLGSGE